MNDTFQKSGLIGMPWKEPVSLAVREVLHFFTTMVIKKLPVNSGKCKELNKSEILAATYGTYHMSASKAEDGASRPNASVDRIPSGRAWLRVEVGQEETPLQIAALRVRRGRIQGVSCVFSLGRLKRLLRSPNGPAIQEKNVRETLFASVLARRSTPTRLGDSPLDTSVGATDAG